MKKFKVKTPVSNFSGKRLGVLFQNGIGETDDEKVAVEFESWGYEVEEQKKPAPKKPKTQTKTEK